MKFNTKLLHGKAVSGYADASTLPHISQAVEYRFDSAERADRTFHHMTPDFAYTRVGNPTTAALERRIAEAEGADGAYACASGMAAILAAILNIVQAGDSIISETALYGGSLELFEQLERLGIHVIYVPQLNAKKLEKTLTADTKLVFAEMISNPALRVLNLPALAETAHKAGAAVLIDSTTATPWLVNPLSLGADIVVHSTTKYISGSGQAMGGVIAASAGKIWTSGKFQPLEDFQKYGPFAYLVRLRTVLGPELGGCMSPFHAYLTILGLETLGLRMERITKNAEALAKALERMDRIEVTYPTLASSKEKDLADQLLKGSGGGIVTFRAGSRKRAFSILNNLQYAVLATSLGDVRTLVIHPDSTLFANTTKKQREAAEVFDDTIRVSVGIEDADDLIEDFSQAVGKS
ncbi:MAG: aminotransferase class V-fold PLP-dependent enzyme [Eubacterium sp.]|nr:aminotransferase class V-fold PLP-dependent enzyme [Eubacterium sp.]